MDCDLYADLDMSASEGEQENVESPGSSKSDAAGMDLMDEGLTSKFKPTAAPQVAHPPRVDVEVEKLKHEVAALKKDNEILHRNLLLLYKTAHHVVQLKDKELSNLRTKYDAMCFRRREAANSSALPSIAPVVDHQQNTDAKVPDRSTPALSNCPQLKDQPKRPTMLTEFSSLQRYAQVGRSSKARSSETTATVPANSVENDAVHLSEKSSDSKACDTKQETDLSSDRRDAIRRSASRDGRREDSHRRARHSDRDQYTRGNSGTPRRGSRNRSPVGKQCLEERRNDRKRARGSSEEDHGTKKPRHEIVGSDEGSTRHRGSRTEHRNSSVAEGVKSTRARSVKDALPFENTSRDRGRELSENRLEDAQRPKQSRSRSNREADASKKDEVESKRATDLDKNRSNPKRTCDERSSGSDLKKEQSRTSRSSDKERSRLDDSRRTRTPDSRRSTTTEVTKHRNVKSSSREIADRDSEKSDCVSVSSGGGATRNRGVDTHRSEQKIRERERKDGATRSRDAGSPRYKGLRDRDCASKGESRAPENDATSGSKRHSRRPSSANSRRNEDKSLRPDEGPGGRGNECFKGESVHVLEEKPSCEGSRTGISDATVENIAGALEDGEIVEEVAPTKQEEGHNPDSRATGAASGPQQKRIPPLKILSRGPQETQTEKLIVKRRGSKRGASTSQHSHPGCSSKPTSESEKEASVVRSETPVGVQVNQCDSPQAAVAKATVNSQSASTSTPTVTELRRSPRKCMRVEREARPPTVRERDLPEMVAEQNSETQGESTAETWKSDAVQPSAMILGESIGAVSGIRRSPRKSVRDRNPLRFPQMPQGHEVAKSPQVKKSPMKLRKIAAEIPLLAVGGTGDPRSPTGAVRMVLLGAISYSAPTNSPEFDYAAESPNLIVENPSPRRSPRKVQIEKLSEKDTALLHSLLGSQRMEPPRPQRGESSSGSLDNTSWLDDLPCDNSRVPETPGKNLDLGEFENSVRQNPGPSNI